MTLLIIEGGLRIARSRLMFELVDDPGKTEKGIFVYDEALGWKLRPGFTERVHRGYRVTTETINEDGWRDRRYPKQKPPGTYRIAVIGCSRTYGLGVDAHESYPKQLEDLFAEAGSDVEVLNFGVNGYGLSQMTLNYEHRVRDYAPDLVILQLLDSTLIRSLYTENWSTPKPAFSLSGDELVLLSAPVPTARFRPFESWLVDRSRLYKLVREQLLKLEESRKLTPEEFAQDRAARALASRIIERLGASVERDGSELVVFTRGKDDPWKLDVIRDAGIPGFSLEDYESVKQWQERGDTRNPKPTGHWSPHGNRFVATAIFGYLKAMRPEILTR